MTVAALTPLREQLAAVVQTGREAGPAWPTGIARLDRALGGGIPRGRITEVTGAVASGKTALLRQVVAQLLQAGQWVAWIDARRTLAPAPWAGLGSRFVVVRPPEVRRSAWIADLLLRSGVFACVVLDGAPPLSRVHGVRLAQLARERDAACVVLTHHHPGERVSPSRVAGAVRLHVALHAPARGIARRQPAAPLSMQPPARQPVLRIAVEKGGQVPGHQPLEVSRVVVMARRVCTNSEIPDRRGVARSARRPWTARGNSSDAAVAAAGDASTGQYIAEHPVTWGGLGVAAHDLYGTDLPGHPARLAAGFDDGAGHSPSDRLPVPPARDREHLREHIRERDAASTRDWTTYRGRRRAAESEFGRPSRRTRARERASALGASALGAGGDTLPLDTLLGQHGGQGRPRTDTPRRGRDTRNGSSTNSNTSSNATPLG